MSSVVTLRQFYADFYEPLRLRSRADNTKRLYLSTLRTFAKFLEREPLVSDLTDLTVSRFLTWFHKLGRAAGSVNKEHSNLTAIWRFAYRRGLLTEWPNVEREIEPQREPQAWFDWEMRALYQSIQLERGTIAGQPATLWWQALILLIWDTGERIGGITGLTWDRIDLSQGWVNIPAEIRKGRKRDMLWPLKPETVAALKLIKVGRSGPVFPWDRAPTYLWYRFGKICERAGLPNNSKSKFHRVRKTVASYYEAAGGNATELLGHTNRKTTLRYIDRRIVKVPSPAEKLFRLVE